MARFFSTLWLNILKRVLTGLVSFVCYKVYIMILCGTKYIYIEHLIHGLKHEEKQAHAFLTSFIFIDIICKIRNSKSFDI